MAGFPQDPIQAVADEMTAATACMGDLSSQAIAEVCVQTAIGQFGQLDILVNNAGTIPAVSELGEYLIKNNI